ncbi:MAG: ATP-binding cassette domain-containing protein [Acidimicrobiia bacterium]|nr:ATP-binding cassette domain-containing protein [Acidimicrobiia bacterium]
MVEGGVNGNGLSADISVQRSTEFRLGLDLAIPPGRTTALLGPNGAGKSTAVAAISGLLPIDKGRIALGDVVVDYAEEDLFVAPEERSIGVVFQDYLLFPHLTVLGNIAFGLRGRGVPRDTAERRAREWVGCLGLDGLERTKPRDLSGGQAQRVALARALAIEPDLLLLDEPLSALDVSTRSLLRRTLGEYLDGFDGPRLLITHDPIEAFLLADEIHVIENGKVTQVGSADDIRLRPRTSYAADLAGSNLIVGRAAGGSVDTGRHVLTIADSDASGEVLVTIHPHAISVHRQTPEGSQRNVWETTIERVEDLGGRIRLRTSDPLPLTVEITKAASIGLGLGPGERIWVAVKATEIGVDPA